MTSSASFARIPTEINNGDIENDVNNVRKPLLTVTTTTYATENAELESGMLTPLPLASPRAPAQAQGNAQALNDLYGLRWPPRPLFIVQGSISAAVVLFCCVMLATHSPGCEMQPYLTMLSTIIALWVPNPKNV